jgi:hypothetical protein
MPPHGFAASLGLLPFKTTASAANVNTTTQQSRFDWIGTFCGKKGCS